MLNIYNYTPTVGIANIYDKISENNIIEVRSLRANSWNNAVVLSKHVETLNNNLVYIIDVYMRKSIYNLIDLYDFQTNYLDSYDYERNIKYIRISDVNTVKNIYTYEKGNSKEEAIKNALIKYGIINNNILKQNNFKITTHSKNNRLNSKKYIKLWEKDNVICEFWFKEPNNINTNESVQTWEIDLIKKM